MDSLEFKTQICKACNIEKPLNKFKIEQRISGEYIRKICRSCSAKAYYPKKRENEKKNPVSRHPTVSIEQYVEMEQRQEYKCAICKISFSDLSTRPCIDHCHTTNKVRGLLCMKCNLGLGYFQDNPEFCNNAADYLINSINFNSKQ